MPNYYLYAICAGTTPPLPDRYGIAEAALEVISHADLSAVVSPLEAERVELTRANLLRHEAVVEDLMALGPTLPARFGTVGSATRIGEGLATSYAEHLADLVRLGDKVEIALRILRRNLPPNPAPPERSRAKDGRSYMLERLELVRQSEREHAEASALVTNLTAGLRELAVAVEQAILPTPRTLLKAAYLIERERLPEVRAWIERLNAAHPDLAIMATGPWPVYSFVRQA